MCGAPRALAAGTPDDAEYDADRAGHGDLEDLRVRQRNLRWAGAHVVAEEQARPEEGAADGASAGPLQATEVLQ